MPGIHSEYNCTPNFRYIKREQENPRLFIIFKTFLQIMIEYI